MTDIEQKALALVAQLQEEDDGKKYSYAYHFEALCRAIEQHEAFRQEVSKIIEDWWYQETPPLPFRRFIIAKPDPLVEALEEASGTNDPVEWANRFYAAIEKRGGKIVWGEG